MADHKRSRARVTPQKCAQKASKCLNRAFSRREDWLGPVEAGFADRYASASVKGTSRYFESDRAPGVRLHALCWGDPERVPLILLHGGGANAHWWEHLAGPFADRFHVVAPDFRGHGRSDHPDDRPVGAFNEDLESVLGVLGRSDVVLIGHSMGGHVALDHAARHPETRGLALLDIVGGARSRTRRMARLALSLRRNYASREEAIARYRFLPPAPLASEELRTAIAEASTREEPGGRFGFNFDPHWFSVPSRPRPPLSMVRCPVLLVRGEASEMLLREPAEAMVEEFPNAQLCEIPSAGHHVQIESPGAVLDALLQFTSPLA